MTRRSWADECGLRTLQAEKITWALRPGVTEESLHMFHLILFEEKFKDITGLRVQVA